MKKILSFVLLAFFVSTGYTQTIPNGSLENWDSISTNLGSWWQPSYEGYNWLGTLNSLVDIPVTMGGPGPVTCFKTTDSKSGTYAAKIVSENLVLVGSQAIFIPGMLGTAVMDKIRIRAVLGNPCPGCKPLHFKGWYKFEPVENDSCAILVLVSRWNTETHKRDTLAFNQLVQKNPVSTYEPFDLELSYSNDFVSDSLTFLMVSSAGFNMNTFMDCHGNEGSTMYVDEVSLEYPAGLEQSLMPEVGVSIYPNPASEQVTFELSDRLINGSIEIYSLDGKLLRIISMNELKTTISVRTFPSGSYFFKLKQGNGLMNTGSFLVK